MTSDSRPEGVAPEAPSGVGAAPSPLDRESGLAVRCSGVSKRFGSVQALDDVSLELRKGTVHALVGENGSGKSTLTKIIAGAHSPDSGDIWINGEHVPNITPRIALEHGVRVIYQDLALFPNMTVAENVGFEGSERALGKVPRRAHKAAAASALAKLGSRIDPESRLGDLSTAERQLVAIARAVSSDGKIILMDEPTASLTQDEIDSLLSSVRSLAAEGVSFIFISHKLREVVEIADDVTVIRDGKRVATGPASEFDQDRISYLMTGTEVMNVRRDAPPAPSDQPVVEVRGLSLGKVFQDISLSLRAGRVLGLSGLVGCGKIEIGQAIAGLIPVESGEIRFQGRLANNMRREAGLQYVPDDRLTEGLYLDWSIAENIVLTNLDESRSKVGLQSTAKQRAGAQAWRERLAIKTPSVDAPVSSLSGGNQQRVLLARVLAPSPSVVIFNNPTVGVDVGSRAAIHDLIRSVADEQTAVLIISDEPAEVLSVSDDVAFIVRGRLTEVRDAAELSEEDVIDLNQGEVIG